MTAPRIPPNFFGIPFGIAGLGAAWATVGAAEHAPELVSTIIFLIAAAVWLLVLVAYLRFAIAHRRTILEDLQDPVAAPFTALVLITPLILAANALHPHAATAGRIIVDIAIVLLLLLGGGLTGQWIYGSLSIDKIHPGYFLPTVAGGFLGAAAAATVGQQRLGYLLFGLGLACWLVLGSIMLGRLMLRPLPPTPLLPTIAIEIAPAAVASLAWFALHGDQIDAPAAGLGGYGLLMVLAQLRLLPAYLRLPFMPSTWSFTFSWAAVATAGIHWLENLRPTGYRVGEYIVLASVTLLIGAIGLRTVIALRRRQLLGSPLPPV